MASAISHIAKPGCSVRDGVETDAGMSAKARDDIDEPEAVESKVDITLPDKTSILVSY